ALRPEEAFFAVVGGGGVALSGLHIHDRRGEFLRRDDARIAVLAGPARPDEAVLRALVAFDLGVLECRPVRLLLAEAPDIFLHDVLEGNIDQFRRTLMPCNAHGSLLFQTAETLRRIYAFMAQRVNEAGRPPRPRSARGVTCVPPARAPRRESA